MLFDLARAHSGVPINRLVVHGISLFIRDRILLIS
jgi:hypothetical protein